MTAETDLLPLPEADGFMESFDTYGCPVGAEDAWAEETVKDYARANLAPLQAEIEALRAEVERLKSMTAVTMGIGSGDGSLFVHGDYDSIKAAQALVFRAERLEEALKEIRNRTAMNLAMRPDPVALTAMLGDIHQIADAALSGGSDNDR